MRLFEMVFNIDEDVELIYKKYFESLTQNILSNKWDGKLPSYVIISSSRLVSKPCQDAHELNPVFIHILGNGNGYSGNFYNFKKKIISITYNDSALNAVRKYGKMGTVYSLDEAVADLNDYREGLGDQLRTEFDPRRIKGTIRHELAHWIDDSLHGSHYLDYVNKHGIPTSDSVIERNSQIYNIIDLMQSMSQEEWDSLTFEQMVNLNPSLNTIYHELRGTKKFDIWKRKILQRLAREGLLGKRMKVTEGVGRIVKGINTTIDVGVDEIAKQAKKFGFTVTKDGIPPLLGKFK